MFEDHEPLKYPLSLPATVIAVHKLTDTPTQNNTSTHRGNSSPGNTYAQTIVAAQAESLGVILPVNGFHDRGRFPRVAVKVGRHIASHHLLVMPAVLLRSPGDNLTASALRVTLVCAGEIIRQSITKQRVLLASVAAL
ncbi:hypothetical protein Bbelb_306540 [Branchiostoma belcheri]|nr:hypothetical protein Bbelb_306540 [Branchiostoma belcheri]